MKSDCLPCRLVAVLFVLLAAQFAHAALPPSLNYQAYLADDNGVPIDGLTSITFNVYNVELGGTPLWTDSRTVDVQQGIFSVELGDTASPFPVGLFETPLWIGIAVEADSEMIPRRPLTTTGYAFKAQDANTLDGSTASALDQSAHVGDSGNPHGVTAAQVGAVDATELDIHATSPSAHHVRYSDTEAVSAMGANSDTNPLHHNKFTSSNAYKAILLQDGAGSNIDADLLDGLDSTAFMPLGTDLWVNTSGDTMNGTLLISGGNRLGIGVASASYPLHVNGEVKLGNKVRLGSAEYFEDGGTNTISTGPNSLQVGGMLSSTGVLEADGGIRFADGTIQNTAAGSIENRFVVAKSGGDYPTIQAAINAAIPTDTDPVVIEVAPGVYTESVVMKSHIHLRGSGAEQTIIIPDTAGASTDQELTAIWLDNLQNVRVSGFTLYGGDTTTSLPGTIGIRDIASSPVIENVIIKGFVGAGIGSIDEAGIYSSNSSPQVYNSEINANGSYGILLAQATGAKVIGNSFRDNIGTAPAFCAMTANGSEALVSSNRFSGNGAPLCANDSSGVESRVVISSNQLTGNFDGIRMNGNVHSEIIGNQISTTNTFGIGIHGGDIGGATRIIGNSVVGTELGIIAPSAATIIGNHVEAACGGGCPAIQYFNTDSEVVGNYSNYGYGNNDDGVRMKTNGYRFTSILSDGSGAGRDITFVVGSTRVIIGQDGDVTIDADGDIALTGTNVSIEATNNLDMTASNRMNVTAASNLTMNSGALAKFTGGVEAEINGPTVDINGAASTLISAGSEVDITGNALVDINGSQITLN